MRRAFGACCSGWPALASAVACDAARTRVCSRGDDGVFFIAWEDFIAHYNKLYLCSVFGGDWHSFVLQVRAGLLRACVLAFKVN